MLLNNCELTPAVILNNDDPEHLGRIKCQIPGILDSSTMSVDNMPWIYPFCMSGYQTFSKPVNGQKVWVICNKSNYNEYWYLPFFEYNKITKDYLEEHYEDNPEVFMSRNIGENSVIQTYNDTEGFNTQIGQNHIVFEPEGRIEMLNHNIQVEIKDDGVKCGNNGEEYSSSVRYDKLKDLLDNLANKLMAGGNAISANPYTSGLGKDFIAAAQNIQKTLSSLEAKNCKVN